MKLTRLFVFCALLLCLAASAQAQMQLFPFSKSLPQPASSVAERRAPLALPFFDDFSNLRNNSRPDPLLWNSKGVQVNNTLAINPPSMMVATLDSYDDQGDAYDLSSPFASGFSDTLQSKPIDLSGVGMGNSTVFLSFYWQAQGLGEQPDNDDFIVLQGKDNMGAWVELWRKEGGFDIPLIFQQELIALGDAFFHADFQFQFLRFGRNSGYYDVWHLDYIYLNSGRSVIDIFSPDVAMVREPGSYLRKYAAMPVNQFFANQSAYLGEVMNTTVNSLRNDPRLLTNSARLREVLSNTELGALPLTVNAPDPGLISPGDSYELRVNPIPISPTGNPMILETRIIVDAGDNNTDLPPINFRRNDTIFQRTVLNDYFAYDDGTAEFVAGIRQRFGRLAVQFILEEPAQLTDIDIAFFPFEADQSNQTFVLSVWRRLNVSTEEVLFQRSVQVRYPDVPNGFVRFAVDSFAVVNISDTFYVGIQQTTDDLLAIGFDKNTNSQPFIFENTQGLWEQNPNIEGSLMIRPVFSVNPVTSLAPVRKASWALHPNPTQDMLYLRGQEAAQNVRIFDMLGRRQEAYEWYPEQQALSLKALQKGMYILELQSQSGAKNSYKIIVE
jgi:hypothetical protein